MAQDTATLKSKAAEEGNDGPGSQAEETKKSKPEQASSDEKKNVLDAALAILEKRRGLKIGGSVTEKKPEEKPKTVTKLKTVTKAKPVSKPAPAVKKAPKVKVVPAAPIKQEKKPVAKKPKTVKAEAKKADLKRKEKVFTEKATAVMPDEFFKGAQKTKKASRPEIKQPEIKDKRVAKMKEDMLKEEYNKKLASEREARMRAEARARVDDTHRKILKAEREEKKQVKADLESKLVIETEAKATILKELGDFKRELAYLRSGSAERLKAEAEIKQLREMLSEKDREIFRYKKQIDERADKKITAIIETIKTKKAPAPKPAAPPKPKAVAPAKPAPAPKPAPVKVVKKKEEPKHNLMFEDMGDISGRNPIFDGIKALEVEKPEPAKPAPEVKQPNTMQSAASFNRISQYLSKTRMKSNRYRQALLVAVPIAFLLLVVLGARALFSKAPTPNEVAGAAVTETMEPATEESAGPGLNPIFGGEFPRGASIGRQDEEVAEDDGWAPLEKPDEPVEIMPIERIPAPTPLAEPQETTYKVQPGDSLWVICKKQYGAGIYHSALSKHNGLTKNQLLKIGQELKMPSKDKIIEMAKSN